jgi:hypothetical protein
MRGTTLSAGSKKLARVAVLHQFHGRQHALAAHLADIGVFAHGLAIVPRQVGADIARIRDEAEAVEKLQVRHTRRRADGMGGVGPAVAERAVHRPCRAPARPRRRPDTMLNRQRRIGRGQALGDGHDVGRDPVMGEPNMEPRRPKPVTTSSAISRMSCLRRIGSIACPVARGRRHDAARAQHRLRDEGGDGVGAFRLDQRLQIGGALGGELRLVWPRVLAPEIVGRLVWRTVSSGRSNFL